MLRSAPMKFWRLQMRYLLTIAMAALALGFLACQTAKPSSVSSTKRVETKNGKPADSLAKETELTNRTADANEHADDHEAARITIADAKQAYDDGDAVFLDSRSKHAYENEHIEGAINIPTNEIEKRYKEIPKDKIIIVYCS